MAGQITSSIHPSQLRAHSFYTAVSSAFVTIIGLLQNSPGAMNQIPGYRFLRHHHPALRRHRLHVEDGGSRSTTSPVAACRRCSTAWRPARTGCRRRLHRHGGYPLPVGFITGSPSSWAGPAATAWLRCSWRPTFASSANSRSRLPGRPTAAIPRLIGVLAAIVCSFTYVIAQIYGVGLITSRACRRRVPSASSSASPASWSARSSAA